MIDKKFANFQEKSLRHDISTSSTKDHSVFIVWYCKNPYFRRLDCSAGTGIHSRFSSWLNLVCIDHFHKYFCIDVSLVWGRVALFQRTFTPSLQWLLRIWSLDHYHNLVYDKNWTTEKASYIPDHCSVIAVCRDWNFQIFLSFLYQSDLRRTCAAVCLFSICK